MRRRAQQASIRTEAEKVAIALQVTMKRLFNEQVRLVPRNRVLARTAQTRDGVARLSRRVRVSGARTGGAGGQPIMRHRLRAIAHGLERTRDIELGLRAGRAGGRGVLVVSQRMGEVTGGEAIAALARRGVHHGAVASAGRRRGRAVGTLVLQRRDLLFKLIELSLLLIKLALVGLDRVMRTSGKRWRDHQNDKHEKESGQTFSHTLLFVRSALVVSIEPCHDRLALALRRDDG
jgi:hypothetical protein